MFLNIKNKLYLKKGNRNLIKKQFLRFIIIGCSSTFVNYSIFFILFEYFSIYYIIASGTGFVSGVFFGYGFNKSWTFEIKKKTKSYILKYFTIYAFSLFLGLGILKLLVEVFGIIPEIANILTIGVTTIVNFSGVKFWVFKK